jgi:hypothetical protein
MMGARGAALTLVVCLFGVPASRTSAGLPEEQIRSLFSQANEAFRQANSIANDEERAHRLYDKAILNYEKMINDGEVRNGKLYYNLANAYFLKGDLGRAILNYRRAEKLDSSDAKIEKNLAFARSKRADRFQIKTEKRVLHTLFFWHYDFSIRARFFLTCLFFAGVCIALTITVWLGRTGPATATVVICGMLMSCLLASVIVEARHQARTVCGVITAKEVVARQGDGQNYTPSFTEPLHAGTEFDVLEHRPGWLHVQLSDDTSCWIPEGSAELI